MGKALRPKSKRKRDKIERAKNSGSSTKAYVSTEQDKQDEQKFWKIAGIITLVVLVLLYFVFQ